jgi:hypothetical protein
MEGKGTMPPTNLPCENTKKSVRAEILTQYLEGGKRFVFAESVYRR